MSAVTKYTALVAPVTVKECNRIVKSLSGVAQANDGRVYFVFSLHADDDPIWGVFRPPPGETESVTGDIDDWGG